MSNRRRFLASLGASAVGLALPAGLAARRRHRPCCIQFARPAEGDKRIIDCHSTTLDPSNPYYQQGGDRTLAGIPYYNLRGQKWHLVWKRYYGQLPTYQDLEADVKAGGQYTGNTFRANNQGGPSEYMANCLAIGDSLMLGWRNLDNVDDSAWYLIYSTERYWTLFPNGGQAYNIPNGEGTVIARSHPNGQLLQLIIHNPSPSPWTPNDIWYRFDVFGRIF